MSQHPPRQTIAAYSPSSVAITGGTIDGKPVANVPTTGEKAALTAVAAGNVSATQKNLLSTTELAVVDGLLSIKDLPVTALTFTPAYLTGATDATAVIATWQAVTAGSFAITINGVAYTISGLDFSTDAAMANAAARIQAAIRAATGALCTCVWSTDHFIITSASTANTSAVTVTSATGAGTDISGAAGGSRFLSCNTSKGTATARAHGTYTLLATDRRIRCSCTATDPVWLLVPTCAIAGDGKQYVVVDTGGGSTTNAITIVHNGAETMQGVAADLVLQYNGGEVIITCVLSTTNWTKNVGSAAQLATTDVLLSSQAVIPYAVSTRTLTAADVSAFATDNYATAITVTLPADADANIPVLKGGECFVLGAGTVSIAPAGGVTLYPATTRRCAQNGGWAWKKIAANTYVIVGKLFA